MEMQISQTEILWYLGTHIEKKYPGYDTALNLKLWKDQQSADEQVSGVILRMQGGICRMRLHGRRAQLLYIVPATKSPLSDEALLLAHNSVRATPTVLSVLEISWIDYNYQETIS